MVEGACEAVELLCKRCLALPIAGLPEAIYQDVLNGRSIDEEDCCAALGGSLTVGDDLRANVLLEQPSKSLDPHYEELGRRQERLPTRLSGNICEPDAQDDGAILI